jgi:hypothetical protein
MVLAENGKQLALLNDDLLDDGEEIVGGSKWLVTKQIRFMGAAGVEESKGN